MGAFGENDSSPGDTASLSTGMKVLAAFLTFFILRDLLTPFSLYGEARGALKIPVNEVFNAAKHPREAYGFVLCLLIVAFDVYFAQSFFKRSRKFRWLMPVFVGIVATFPVLRSVLIIHYYPNLSVTAQDRIFSAGLGNSVVSTALLAPWIPYVWLSKSIRSTFASK